MKLRHGLGASFLLLSLLGCGATADGATVNAGTQATDKAVMSVCTSAASADTFNSATGIGCQARSMLDVCQVPSGSTVNSDGTITTPDGSSVVCTPTCNVNEFTMACRAPIDATGPVTGEIPAPAAALGCKIVPLPTPQTRVSPFSALGG